MSTGILVDIRATYQLLTRMWYAPSIRLWGTRLVVLRAFHLPSTLGDAPSSCPEHSTLGDAKSSVNIRLGSGSALVPSSLII